MKALLLTWGLGFMAALQTQALPTSASGTQNILGKWYVKAIALKARFQVEKISPITISKLASGDLVASVVHMDSGRCQKEEKILKRTDVPDRYLTFEGTGYLQVEGLSAKDHCLFYCEREAEGKQFQVTNLMGRSPEEDPEALEEFREFARRRGFQEEDISVPQRIESCAPGRD